ncbi:MAG: LD-carboxypeptidase [Armatimonadetes bacterium]|nr:LD-carboxypeptidase [Armatimonadota bacterium]
MPSVLPPALPEGATLGIVAPASPPCEERLTRGLEALRERGFRLVLAPHLRDRYGHLAGADVDRAADLHAMFADPAVDGVLCARGGNGASRLLPYLDFNLIRRHPKPFVGYSDVTTLLLAIWIRCEMPTFFAPMVQPDFARRLAPACWDAWWRLLSCSEPAGILHDLRCQTQATTLVSGTAEGVCMGGTLSLLAALLGTPFQPDLAGCVLFLEDIHEHPGRVERYLMQLRLAGLLDDVAGFLIGTTPYEADEEERRWFLPVEQVYRDILVPLGKPLVYNFPIGHEPQPLSLPIGVRVQLDADRRELAILEPAVRPRR